MRESRLKFVIPVCLQLGEILMNLEEKHYDAFISYRHKDLDKYVAETLHRELEAFRVPKNMYDTLDKLGVKKRKIERVFRDRDELPITNNLEDPIINALQNSDFLLVICTPRLPESIWCKTEIENFIKMHGRSHVFAVLAEGEPEDSFPEALLHDENGKAIEPLAADVRGESKAEIKKKIKEEVIRLAAPMFGLSFDDLKQRHREQKIKRIVRLTVSVASVFAVFGIVSTLMAVRINKQAEKISEQAAQLEEQYKDSLYRNSSSLAEKAQGLIEEGRIDEALEVAYRAAYGTDEERVPYNPDAQYALTNALRTYEVGQTMEPNRVLSLDGDVALLKVSPDGSKLLAVDNYGNAKVWTPLDGKEIWQGHIKGSSNFMSEDCVVWIDENRLVSYGESGPAVYDIKKNEEKNILPELTDGWFLDSLSRTLYSVCAAKKGSLFGVSYYDHVAVYDSNTYEELYCIEEKEGYSMGSSVRLSDDGKLFIYSQDDGDGRLIISVLHTDTGEIDESGIIKADSMAKAVVGKDYIYASIYSYASSYKIADSSILKLTKTAQTMDSFDTENSLIKRISVNVVDDKERLNYYFYDTYKAIDCDSFEEIATLTLPDSIVRLGFVEGAAHVYPVTRTGKMYVYVPSVNEYKDTGTILGSNNIECAIFGEDYYALCSYSDCDVVICMSSDGKKGKIAYTSSQSISSTTLSDDESMLALYANNDPYTVTILDTKDYSVKRVIPLETYLQDKLFGKDGSFIYVYREAVHKVDLDSGEDDVIYEMNTLETDSWSLYTVVDENTMFGYNINEGINKINMKTGEKELIADDVISSAACDDYYLSEDGSVICYPVEEGIKILKDGKTSLLKEKINTIEYICVDTADKNLYVSYINGDVKVFSLADLSMIHEYENFGVIAQANIDKTTGDIMLSMEGEYYILDKNGDRKTHILNCAGVLCKKGEVLSFNKKDMYKIPYFTREELIEEAASRLN